MALLALVAAAEPRGISRDKILGILWAERSEDQARHTLSQNLYTLKRELGLECVVGGSQLRLSSALATDVGEFRKAVAADDLGTAASLYAGPFLDGFYLPGVAEFERWVEEEREELRRIVGQVLETLATRADARGAASEAVGWWTRLHGLDPYHSTHAVGLLGAIAASGNRLGALRFAQDYADRLRRDLEVGPEPLFARAVAAVRAASVEPEPTAKAPPSVPSGPGPPIVAASSPRWRGRSWLRPVLAALAALVALGWGVVKVRALAERTTPLLAVGAIHADPSGGSEAVLRDMLATNLARVEGIRVLANSRLLELTRGAGSQPGAVAEGARRAGVEEILEGELTAETGGFLLSLRRIEARSGVLRQGYQVRGPNPVAVVDSATAVIARGFRLAPPISTVTEVRTASPAAYALYEEGLRALYQWDGAASFRLFSAAMARDTSFAMAAYWTWRVGEMVGRYEEARQAKERARHLAPHATDRERLLIRAGIEENDAPVSQFLETARELTRRYPDDPDGQITLGQALFSSGDWAQSIAAYERAIALDSASGASHAALCRVCNAFGAMTDSYLWWDSATAAERAGRRLITVRPTDGPGWGRLVEAFLRQDRWDDAQAAMANANLRFMGTTSFDGLVNRGLIRSGRFSELDVKLESDLRSAPPETPGEAPWLLTISFRNQGRFRDAAELAQRVGVSGTSIRLRGPPDHLSLGIIELERGRPREAARQFLDVVAADRSDPGSPGYRARILTWHMTLAGTALAAAGDTAAVRELADSVERTGPSSPTGRDARLHHFLRGLLLARQDRHAEAVDEFRRSLFSLTDGYSRTNLEMARSLLALGRPADAIAILRPALRGGVDGSNSYVTHTELHEALARAFERAGQSDSAAVHFRRVERAWRFADPELTERYRVAKAKAGQSPH